MNPARRRLCALPLALWWAATPLHAAPPGPLPGATLRGQATMRFLGLSIYEARLWAAAGFEPDNYLGQAFALELIYARALNGSEIVERSLVEMRRLDTIDAERERGWRHLMQRAFPDVGKGDRLCGVHEGAGAVRFLHNDAPTVSTQDRDFARLFFGIWLSPKTSEPDMRRALIAG